MEIQEYTNMEVEQMDMNTMLIQCIQLQKATDKIKMSMDFIKERMGSELEKSGEKKFTNTAGEVSFVAGKTLQRFDNKIAKELLGTEVDKCMVPQERKGYVKVLSAEAAANQVF